MFHDEELHTGAAVTVGVPLKVTARLCADVTEVINCIGANQLTRIATLYLKR